MKKHPEVGGNKQSLIPKVSNYSQSDLNALSKMAPGTFPSSNLVLCDLCGQPIAGSAISKPEEFAREMSAGRHFACHMKYTAQAQESAAAYQGIPTPKWADESLSEEERARAFNTDDSGATDIKPDGGFEGFEFDDDRPGKVKNFYEPPSGSLPLDKVLAEGGLSAKDPKDIPVPPFIPDDEQVTQDMADFRAAQTAADEAYRKQFEDGDPGLVGLVEAETETVPAEPKKPKKG